MLKCCLEKAWCTMATGALAKRIGSVIYAVENYLRWEYMFTYFGYMYSHNFYIFYLEAKRHLWSSYICILWYLDAFKYNVQCTSDRMTVLRLPTSIKLVGWLLLNAVTGFLSSIISITLLSLIALLDSCRQLFILVRLGLHNQIRFEYSVVSFGYIYPIPEVL
jgi:hypothetical protein